MIQCRVARNWGVMRDSTSPLRLILRSGAGELFLSKLTRLSTLMTSFMKFIICCHMTIQSLIFNIDLWDVVLGCYNLVPPSSVGGSQPPSCTQPRIDAGIHHRLGPMFQYNERKAEAVSSMPTDLRNEESGQPTGRDNEHHLRSRISQTTKSTRWCNSSKCSAHSSSMQTSTTRISRSNSSHFGSVLSNKEAA